MSTLPLAIIIFFIGASLASFAGALFTRKNLSNQLTTRKRSHCDHCGKILEWYELIPVFGYLMSLGRCQHCNKVIPVWYVFSEVLGGLMALGIASLLWTP